MSPNSLGLKADLADLKENLDILFLVVIGMIIYLMQCDFAFLEAGSVRSKNTSNILIKNLLDSFVAGLAYWTLGYAFASFIGRHGWASHELPMAELATFFIQFVFTSTAATIISRSMAAFTSLIIHRLSHLLNIFVLVDEMFLYF